MKYVEFRGFKTQRVAIGENTSFMLTEVTEEMPVIMANGDKYQNGCMVTIGHYSFYSQDFYPSVLEKLCSVGTFVMEFTKMFNHEEVKHESTKME